jgi:hypothetical protein
LDSLLEQYHSLNVVVYTHGWHGSAEPDNGYSVQLRGLLQSIAVAEEMSAASASAEVPKVHTGTRHVVGIDIAWRGDSILFPSEVFSVWDRKLAAESVSVGAVQELLAHLHTFYLDNSCHVDQRGAFSSAKQERCGRVRMLVIGHSYGALINLRALTARIATGLNAPDNRPSKRAYSFGDLDVFLNPAVEGTRYEPLFYTASHRFDYLGSDPSTVPEAGAQLPVLVTLQSRGDWATGTFFPIFRRATTLFDNPVGPAERAANIRAAGWVDSFTTHELHLNPASTDECDARPKAQQRYFCRDRMWHDAHYLPMGQKTLYVGAHMTLEQTDRQSSWELPKFMPLWLVKVDSDIMVDHDDIWNPQVVSLVSQLYVSAFRQADRQDAVRKRSLAPSEIKPPTQ